MDTGVYSITNTVNGKVYFGSSLRVKTRLSAHKYALRRNSHHSIVLQRAFNKYGEHSFTFSKLIECSPETRLMHEQQLIDEHKSNDSRFGYNMTKYAHSPAPAVITDEYRGKLSKAQRKSAKKYEFNGEMLCLFDIAERVGIKKKVLLYRVIEAGMSVYDAINKPVISQALKYYDYKNESKTLKQWCDELGINYTTVSQRVRKGFSISEALETPLSNNKSTLLTYNGETLTYKQWESKTGIGAKTLAFRIGKGWSVEQTLSTPSGPSMLEFNGESMTTTDWAKRIGCTLAALYARLENGWSLSDALTKPFRISNRSRQLSRA